jgi:hypothetical protein
VGYFSIGKIASFLIEQRDSCSNPMYTGGNSSSQHFPTLILSAPILNASVYNSRIESLVLTPDFQVVLASSRSTNNQLVTFSLLATGSFLLYVFDANNVNISRSPFPFNYAITGTNISRMRPSLHLFSPYQLWAVNFFS